MDLANDLGNLVSRTTAMVGKYFGGKLPEARQADALDDDLLAQAKGLRDRYEAAMERYAFQDALAEVFKVVARANKYIDETAPWALARTWMPTAPGWPRSCTTCWRPPASAACC